MLAQQDVHNAIGLPSFVVDHVVAQVVSDGIDETKQFLEKNVYDSRDFNVV